MRARKKVLLTSSYTEEGKGRIPQVKSRIQSKRKNFMIVNENYGYPSVNMDSKELLFGGLISFIGIKKFEDLILLKKIVDKNWNEWKKKEESVENNYEKSVILKKEIEKSVEKELYEMKNPRKSVKISR